MTPGTVITDDTHGVFVWPDYATSSMFYRTACRVAGGLVPQGFRLIVLEYDSDHVILEGPARILDAHPWMGSLRSTEIAVSRARVVETVDRQQAFRDAEGAFDRVAR